jgi:hypothetical protein
LHVRDRKPLLESAVEAARARFRPILMTSFAFILGVVPLVLATGAGANARKSIGITVFSGMLASTCLPCCSCRPKSPRRKLHRIVSTVVDHSNKTSWSSQEAAASTAVKNCRK